MALPSRSRTPSSYQVRWASALDEPALVELLRIRHGEEGFGQFDPLSVTEVVRRGISRHWAGIGVIKSDHGIEGSVGLYVSRTWDSDSEYLDGMWIFVHKEFRIGTRLQALVRFAKWTSDQLGRPLMMVNATRDAVPFAQRDTEQLRVKLVTGGKAANGFLTDTLHEIWRATPGGAKDAACHREMPRSGSVFLYDPVEPIDVAPAVA